MALACLLVCLVACAQAITLRSSRPFHRVSDELAPLVLVEEHQSEFKSLKAKFRDPLPALAGCQGYDCLQRYCTFDDGAFSWNVLGLPRSGNGWQRWDLNVTSQAWMTESTGVLWKHHVVVIIPQNLSRQGQEAGWATLILNKEAQETDALQIAQLTGAIAVGVADVPNKGMEFHQEGHLWRREEALKAWTWVQYGRHPDHPEWPIEMPSAKAVVRAMDAVVAFTKELSLGLPNVTPVERFIVTGESKRGMATYSAATVDGRVQGIVPLVMPLNSELSGNWTIANLGGVEESARPYLALGVYNMSSDQDHMLGSLIDPWNYREHLTMPKLVVMAGNDGFFPPDSSRCFFSGMPGPSYFWMIGPARHGNYSISPLLYDEAATFMKALMRGLELPEVAWTLDPVTGSIAATLLRGRPPLAVHLWQAETPTGAMRDFREAKWNVTRDLPASAGQWQVEVAPATNGHWTGFYIEFEFPADWASSGLFRLSTEVSVVPLTRPFPNASVKDPRFQKLVF